MNIFRTATRTATRRSVAAGLVLAGLVLLACAHSIDESEASPTSDNPAQLKHYNITVAELPPPEVQRGPNNFSKVIPKPEGAQLTSPAGFQISTWAEED